jgi:hypothetical protein
MDIESIAKSEGYDRLCAWYLARLRRARLTEQSSAGLSPTFLLDVDRRQLKELSTNSALSEMDKAVIENINRYRLFSSVSLCTILLLAGTLLLLSAKPSILFETRLSVIMIGLICVCEVWYLRTGRIQGDASSR